MHRSDKQGKAPWERNQNKEGDKRRDNEEEIKD